MATASASYRKPEPRLTLEVTTQQISPRRPHTGEICRDLEKLCEMGILEAFRDEYNVVRYRPVSV